MMRQRRDWAAWLALGLRSRRVRVGMHGPGPLQRLWAQLMRWHELSRQRRQLAALGDEMLKDLGLSRADVMAESERPFWDDPLAGKPERW